MARRKAAEDGGTDEGSGAEESNKPPIEMGEATNKNPSGITAVSEKHAQGLGQLRGFGGPGADGATVAGGAVHVATEGGTKPLPVPGGHPEGKEPEGGADGSDQPTSQQAATGSGDADTKSEQADDLQAGGVQ